MERMYVTWTGIIPTQESNRTVHPVAPDVAQYSPQVDHSVWDQLLKSHVKRSVLHGIESSTVDYLSLADDERFGGYLETLAAADMNELTPNEQLALGINAYNALCIGKIIGYYKSSGALPVSINDLDNEVKVWEQPAGVVGGTELSLDHIEHKILRQLWKEPRVHASIVCASASCPDLRAEAFVPNRINAQLDDQCQNWMQNTTKGLAVSKNTLTLSRIFLWFESDFLAVAPGVANWAVHHLPSSHEAKGIVDSGKQTVSYFEYNWLLNQTPDP